MQMFRTVPYALRGLLLLLLTFCLPSFAAAAARIVVVPADDPGEGFNDPTPATPIGGNTGTTRGAQRLIAFQHAADRWGAMLDSNVTIYVVASFDPLGPNVLGQAGTTYIFSDFTGAPGFPGAAFPGTWYHSALADKRAGEDLVPGDADIVAQFSSDANWYFGLDNQHGAQTDLVAVVMHELAHGLGFANFVNEGTGANFAGQTDVYSQFTLDSTTGAIVANLATNTDRKAALAKVDKVVWSGSAVGDAVPYVLKFGRPELNITAPAALADAYRVGTASFGPPLSSPGLAGSVVLANDGVGIGSDACTPIAAGTLAGKIALVDRGTCTFVVKAAVVQAAGAIGLLVANNAAADPPPGLGGVDPTIAIPSAMISQALGAAIKAQLASSTAVTVTLGVDLSQRAGADPLDRAQLYATNPYQPGSSISHFDNIAFRNQLMEPAINPDLTHEVIPPYDLTLLEMRDVGWFPDANVDGTPDASFAYGACSTRVPNTQLSNGAMLTDQARVWYRDCADGARNHGQFVSCVAHTTNAAVKASLITGAQKGAVQQCAAQASVP
ncbi:MAG: peptidase [Acidobacteria bacterium]|nr:peptidase [Acidobacteriota bacterium]